MLLDDGNPGGAIFCDGIIVGEEIGKELFTLCIGNKGGAAIPICRTEGTEDIGCENQACGRAEMGTIGFCGVA